MVIWLCKNFCSNLLMKTLAYDGAFWMLMAFPCNCKQYAPLKVNALLPSIRCINWHKPFMGGDWSVLVFKISTHILIPSSCGMFT